MPAFVVQIYAKSKFPHNAAHLYIEKSWVRRLIDEDALPACDKNRFSHEGAHTFVLFSIWQPRWQSEIMIRKLFNNKNTR